MTIMLSAVCTIIAACWHDKRRLGLAVTAYSDKREMICPILLGKCCFF
jgi:hypothetical protein